jgi:hypothetical protein
VTAPPSRGGPSGLPPALPPDLRPEPRPDGQAPRPRWRLLDDGLLAYGLALLRTLWLAPLLQLVAATVFEETRPLLAPWVVFALLAGGTLAAQIFAHQAPAHGGRGRFGPDAGGGTRALSRGPSLWASLGAALGGLAAVLLAVYLTLGQDGSQGSALLAPSAVPAALAEQIGRALFVLVCAVGLWWWGLRTGSETPGYDLLARDFQLGLLGLLVVLGINTAAAALPRAALLGSLLVYLGVGLFLLALGSFQSTRRYERRYGEQDLPLPSHWWATVGTVVAALLLVALLLSLFFAPGTLGRLAELLGTLLALIGQVVAALVTIVSYPIILLLSWLLSFITLRPFEGELPEIVLPQGQAGPLSDLAGQGSAAGGDPTAVWVAGGVVTVIVIVILFVLALRRFRTPAGEDDVAETHEGILSLDLLKAQLAGLLRRGRRPDAPPPPYIPLEGDDPATRIRRTYQQFLQWAAAHGHARTPGTTPEKLSQELSASFPAWDAQFAAITAAYQEARYGGGATAEAAAGAGAAWQQLLAANAETNSEAKQR